MKNLSTVKSPISMQGALVKSYFAVKKGLDPNKIVHVAIAPCTAKKFEISRNELSVEGLQSSDYVITTNELAMIMKDRKIDLMAQRGEFDNLMGDASGGGIIFGNTGGVMQAAIRTACYNLTGSNPTDNLINLQQIQGLTGLKEATVQIGSLTLNVAVCYEMRNVKVILDQVLNGNCKYDFIEVMACRGGCVGGAGQPATKDTIALRIEALNKADANATTRYSHENTEVKAIYNDYLGEIGGINARKYLHTTYSSKANLLE